MIGSQRRRGRALTINVGDIFGYLHVIEKQRRNNGKIIWRCRCECGAEKGYYTWQLRSGDSVSCGCKRGGDRKKNYERRTIRCGVDVGPCGDDIDSIQQCLHCTRATCVMDEEGDKMNEYQERCIKIRTGVAKLIVDDNAEMWTRTGNGPGFQVEGFRDLREDGGRGQFPGIIIKAKLDEGWVCPRKLHNRKVFYRFYYDTDCSGRERPYLYLASRKGDRKYAGQRAVVISAGSGVFLALEASMRERLKLLKRSDGDLTCMTREDQQLASEMFPSEY